MLIVPPTIADIFETNLTAGARLGTQITASGTAHTKGSYTIIIDPTDHPSYGLGVAIRNVAAPSTNTSMLIDIAFGPTGGGNEEIVVPNLNAHGASLTNRASDKFWYFPGLYIPVGVAVSARCQSVITSDTADVTLWLGQDGLYQSQGGKVADYGTNLGTSHGTSVTPGSGSFGSWTQIAASTSRAHRIWTLGVDALTDTSIGSSSVPLVVEIGIGPDSGNVTKIGGTFRVSVDNTETIAGPMPPFQYAVVPASQKLWARMAAGSTEARGVIIYGMD